MNTSLGNFVDPIGNMLESIEIKNNIIDNMDKIEDDKYTQTIIDASHKEALIPAIED